MSNSPSNKSNCKPQAAFIIIGNEILDGSTKEGNLQTLIAGLKPKGIAVMEVRVVRDEEEHIKIALAQTTPAYDYVFTSGGIGPTHDDITSQSVAAFFNSKLELNQDALQRLTARYEDPSYINDAVKKMACIPVGAKLIDNSISAAPGFQLENVYVLAGVPKVFTVMLAEVLHQIPSSELLHSGSMTVYSGESRIAQDLIDLADPDIEIGSYPCQGQNGSYFVKVVVRSYQQELIITTLEKLAQSLHRRKIKCDKILSD